MQTSAGPSLLQVFLRAGQMAALDKMRTDMMHEAAITIQRHIQGFIVRRRFLRTRAAIVQLQVTLGDPRLLQRRHCALHRQAALPVRMSSTSSAAGERRSADGMVYQAFCGAARAPVQIWGCACAEQAERLNGSCVHDCRAPVPLCPKHACSTLYSAAAELLSAQPCRHHTASCPPAEGCHPGAGWCKRHAGAGGRQAQAPLQGGHHHPELCPHAPPQEPLPGAARCSADHPVGLQGESGADTGHGDKVGTPAAACSMSLGVPGRRMEARHTSPRQFAQPWL